MKPVLYQSATWNDARKEVESCLRYLLRRELQEWSANRFYISIPGDGTLPTVARMSGFFQRYYSIVYRDLIGDRFTAHAPGMFIDTNKLGECTEATFKRFCEIAIHEAAHAVQEQYSEGHFATIVDAPKVKTKRTGKAKPIESKPVEVMPGPFGQRIHDWFDQMPFHQESFIRPLIHLGVRAEATGWYIDLENLTPWGAYAFGGFFRFELCLQDELQAFADKSLTGIWQQPMPDKFLRYWKDNQQASWNNREDHFKWLQKLDAKEAKATKPTKTRRARKAAALV